MIKVAASILSADFLHLGADVQKVTKAGADFIHIDVMDGHFVPNLTMGPLIIEAVRAATSLPLDVHLMITNAEDVIKSYAQAGADYLTIHAESCLHLERAIKAIKDHGLKAGVALNPATPESALSYIIDELDMVLVMSVNPGFAQQQFLPLAIRKIAALKNMLSQSTNMSCVISVDGGINDKTVSACARAGADVIVAGSYIFKAHDYQHAISTLKKSASF